MLAAVAALGAGTFAGCGGAPDPVPTGEVAPGSTVTPPRYLAMVREAVAAARAASIRLDALPAAPTPVQARRAAPGLAAAATRAELAARQISAARLDDQRLEDQRREFGPLYVGFAAALRKAAQAAADGDVAAMGQGVSLAAVQAGRLHEASAPG
ncbi:MAG: hypothetical protein FJW99_08920 [Actinobacteria bacterium]|nr:hypothetical protein [Actinomycetota bacterium]